MAELCKASKDGDLDKVKHLISNGANVNKREEDEVMYIIIVYIVEYDSSEFVLCIIVNILCEYVFTLYLFGRS